MNDDEEYPNLSKNDERFIEDQVNSLARAGLLTPGEAAQKRREMKEALNEEQADG